MTTPQTNRLIKILAPVAFILSLALGGLFAVKSQLKRGAPESSAAHLSEGAQLPDFTVPVFGGGKMTVSELKAKVVLVNFWASWCEACIVEMPSIIELRKSYKDRGLEVLAINVDEKPEAVVPRMTKQLGIDFPVYVDQDGALSELFDVHAIPLTVLIDANRKVLLIHNGERDWNSEEIRSKVERWISG
ncbi:MAG: redoxin family protein [Oligoflexia bacterium]|nr:redoxin family protein [Oligoflexia bacterium]